MRSHAESAVLQCTRAIGFLALSLGLPLHGHAQVPLTPPAPQWSGIWNAEGTLLTLKVTHKDNQLHVEAQESMGYLWRNGVGTVNGNSATLDVEYQGVVARVMVQLGEDGTAMVRPLSCQPDYHVVCALVQNQQARFLRLGDIATQGIGPTSAAMTN